MSARSARTLAPWLLTGAPWGIALLLLCGLDAGPGGELQARGSWPKDLDADGLPDGQERILDADSARWDSDGDGYGDGYEFAAQTSITDPLDHHTVGDVSVNITARGGWGDTARVLVGILAADGSLDDKVIGFGAILGSQRLNIPFSFVLAHSTTTELVQPDGSTLFLFDFRVPGSLMQAYGELTYFVSAGMQGASELSSAAVADIVLIDGIACLRFEVETNGLYSTGSSFSVFKPIPGGGQELPNTWTPGALCMKETEPQSQSGAVVTMFVSNAGCSEPWHGGSCPPDCGQAAGTTFTTVDPFVLIGG